MENKKKFSFKNFFKLLFISIMGLIVFFVVFLVVRALLINYYAKNNKKEDTIINVKDIFNISCSHLDDKPYNGFINWDKIECIMLFDQDTTNFKNTSDVVDEFSAVISANKSLDLNLVYITSPFSNNLYRDFAYTIDKNQIYIKNTHNRDNDHMTCDASKNSCLVPLRLGGGVNGFSWWEDSIKGIELHMVFTVHNNSNSINLEINDIDFKMTNGLHYKTKASYKYDFENNQKFYIDNDVVFKYEKTKYNYYLSMECITEKCYFEKNDDIQNLGYIEVIEYENYGKKDEKSFIRIYDLEAKEDYKNYLELFIKRDSDNNYYLIGNSKDNSKHFTITLLNEKREISHFTIPENSIVVNIDVEKDAFIFNFENGETLEVKKNS